MSPKRTRIPTSTVACQDIASIGTWSPEAPGDWESRDLTLDLEAGDFLIQAMSQCVTNKQASSKGNVGDNTAACGTRAHCLWRRSGDTQSQT